MNNKLTTKTSCTLAGIGLFIAGLGFGSLLGLNDLPNFMDVFFATIIAAFAGTFFAFFIQNRREDRIKQEDEIKTAVSIESNLYRQHKALERIKVNFLDPHCEDSLKYYKVGSPSNIKIDRMMIDHGLLSVFTHSESPDIVRRIMYLENLFRESVDSFNARSQYVVENVYPKLYEDMPEEDELDEPFVRAFLGELIHGMLYVETRIIYNSFEVVFPEYQRIRIEIYNVLSKMYPDHEFLDPDYEPYKINV